MVLNAANNTAAGGENIILWPLQSDSRNELWEYTQSGQFVNAIGDYLGNRWTSAQNPAQPMIMSDMSALHVVASEPSQNGTLEGGADNFQLWKMSTDCRTAQCEKGATIQNQLFGSYLYTSSGSQGQVLALSPAAQAQWVFWPPRNLQGILNESPIPYPTFTGHQLAAYNDISKSLGLSVGPPCTFQTPMGMKSGGGVATQTFTGLRCQYDNLDLKAGALASYQSTMDGLPVAKGISKSDWKAVVKQLDKEILGVELVQGLYDNFNDFYNSLFTNNNTLVPRLIDDVQISAPGTTMVSGRTIAVLEGVLYTTIEGTGGLLNGPLGAGVAAIGNILEAAINGAVASGSYADQNFQVTVDDLYTQLSSDFTGILTASGQNEISILEDWGRLQAVGKLITSTGPDSLAWTPLSTPELVTALEPGFEVAVMRMLLPVEYSLSFVPRTTTADIQGYFSDLPDYDAFQTPQENGVYDFSAIASGNSSIDFVSPFPGPEAIQNDLLDIGVSNSALFTNLNGWSLPHSFGPGEARLANGLIQGFPSATGCTALIVSVINQTADDLQLSLTSNHGNLLGSQKSQDLPPYATDVVGLVGNPDIDFVFCANSGGNACGVAQGTQFEVQQDGGIHYTGIEGDIYFAQELSQTNSSCGSNVPGIVSVAVYNPSANQ